MPKIISILINEDIADTELGKDVSITIETNTYTGTLESILNYIDHVPESTTVTLEGPGLKVNP